MKFENFVKQSNGNEIEAAKALFEALRSERGIHLRYESLPSLLDIGDKGTQKRFEARPQIMRGYALANNLRHPEEIVQHLLINGLEVGCADYLKHRPIDAHCINAKITIQDLKKRGVLVEQGDVYTTVVNYFAYLYNNGVNLKDSKLQDTLNRTLVHQLTDLEKVVDIVTSFGIFLSVCPPKWSPAHKEYSRVLIGEQWRDDKEGKAMKKILEAEAQGKYPRPSHCLCNECDSYISTHPISSNSL